MNEEYPEASQVAELLSKETGVKLSASNYIGWMEGEQGYVKFDKAVNKFLGKETYDKFDSLARLPMKLGYDLGFIQGSICGGVNLK